MVVVVFKLTHVTTGDEKFKEYDVPNIRRNFAVCRAFEQLRIDPRLSEYKVRHFRTKKSPT